MAAPVMDKSHISCNHCCRNLVVLAKIFRLSLDESDFMWNSKWKMYSINSDKIFRKNVDDGANKTSQSKLKDDSFFITGFVTILKAIVSQYVESQARNEGGIYCFSDAELEERIQLERWLYYPVKRCKSFSTEKEASQSILNELNIHLKDHIYLVGYSMTIADIFIFVWLHPLIHSLTSSERLKFRFLNRWAKEIQASPILQPVIGRTDDSNNDGQIDCPHLLKPIRFFRNEF